MKPVMAVRIAAKRALSYSGTAIFWISLLTALAMAQTQPQTQSPGTQSEQIPDAPGVGRPAPSPFPGNTAPAPKTQPAPSQPSPDSTSTPDNTPAPGSSLPPDSSQPPAPPANVKTMSPGQAGAADRNSRNDFTLPAVNVNFVVVPVTVKDTSGRLVEGLLRKDFSVMEDGNPQRIALFTSDPFPLSVAIVLDSNLPDQTMHKINATLPALTAAFSEYDEVGVFTYGNTVQERLAFTAAPQELTTTLRKAEQKGQTNGPPVTGGVFTGGPTPSVNGRPFDPSTPHVSNVRTESSVLNDAILAAAQALSKRDRARRKILFIISDGKEDGSNASYSDVLKVLLSNDVSVYAIAVDAGAIPGYRQLERIRIPLLPYGNILGKYVSATGGQTFAEFTQDSIEGAYAHLTEQARNQYTLGYSARNAAAGNHRSIEVLVHRPGLVVTAKEGYYPLPPPAPTPQK